jgi:pimeloyl-ACP methyl ester carboxylesterase
LFKGIPYPEHTYQARAQSIKNLSSHKLKGSHHVHMDNPVPVAEIIAQFLW